MAMFNNYDGLPEGIIHGIYIYIYIYMIYLYMYICMYTISKYTRDIFSHIFTNQREIIGFVNAWEIVTGILISHNIRIYKLMGFIHQQ